MEASILCIVRDYCLGKGLSQIMNDYDISSERLNDIVSDFSRYVNEGYQGCKIDLLKELRCKNIALRQKNKDFETAVNSSYDGIWITDGKGDTLFINRAIERITGLKKSDVLGKNMRELVEEGVFNISATLEAIRKRDTVTIMQKVYTGIETIVTGNLSFDEDGNIFRVISNVRDITELNELKEKIKKIERDNQRYFAELNTLKLKLKQHNQLIYVSKQMQDVIDLALRTAKFDTTVMVTGETGVGKEIIAELIHQSSDRNETGSFIKVNCAALPVSLLESELFGYEEGAFTGASERGKPGLFELANDGTIFLDEIGELPLETQAKFLRVLQDDEILRVGGTKPIPINTRIIVATNRDLRGMVDDGQFRKDLYYRLNVVPIHIPPLRDRRDDIPQLIQHFLKDYNSKYQMSKKIDADAMDYLINYDWPGNVRELKNIVERLIVTSKNSRILVSDLPENITVSKNYLNGGSLKEMLSAYEKEIILSALKRYGSTYKVAEALGVSQSTISRKARQYDLQ